MERAAHRATWSCAPGEFGLGQVPARLKPDATTTMVCGFCSTGCGLKIHLQGRPGHQSHPGHPLPGQPRHGLPQRLGGADSARRTRPRHHPVAARRRTASWRAVDWDAAMTEFSARFKAMQARHGPHSIAFLGTGQICTEEMALLGALVQIRHGRLALRQQHPPVHGHRASSPTRNRSASTRRRSPTPISRKATSLVFIGANPCIAHPIMWQRVMRNRNRPEIIVVDPRKTETAMAATQHYALKPKSDLTLLYGLANILIASGWIDRAFIARHTTGFDDFAAHVTRFTSDAVSAATGLDRRGNLANWPNTIHRGKRVSFWWTMGVNQSHEATRTAQAIINLALMTGNIGRPGTGANSITGQCNAMGSRLFANITSLIGGHDFADPTHRAKVSAALGIPGERIPAQTRLAYDQILDGIRDGEIKGLWVVATNSSHSWIQHGDLDQRLRKLDFLVVQDMYPTTETARLAHLYLPAAGWGEKEGTFINSERRIGLTKKVRRAPGLALSDFNIFKLAARYWGCDGMFARWSSPEAVFQLLKDVSRGQPCDITGIRDYAMLDECGGIQWPWPAHPPAAANGRAGKLPVERRLFEDGRFFHPDGRARFIHEAPRPMPELPDREFPFLLLTGRGTSAQWHTGSRSNKSNVLRALSPPRCYVEVNPMDAARLGFAPNAEIRVRSRRGALVATAVVTPTVPPGQVFIPMHYAETNRLTLAAFDPYSRQPAYKACAVRLEPE